MNVDELAKFNPGRIPSSRIIGHSHTGCYSIVHFSLNTWTDKEWGYGDEDPALFNPSAFDADALVQACIDGGLDGLILVCKHHSGFCLWPTATTDYNISRSPWRGGRGDLVREVVDACRRRKFRVGFYISPWDRHQACYGSPEYVKMYHEQVREICSNYGPAFEIWLDGANGGDGWYGGANCSRKIDASVYYEWERLFTMLRTLQPEAVIYSDIGPDVRWTGNEDGTTSPDSRGCYTPHYADGNIGPGRTDFAEGFTGHIDGRFYMPPECDTPLRPGWFYHASEDAQVKSSEKLLELYLASVGNGGYLNLGLAPATDGRLAPADIASMRGFKAAVDRLYSKLLASGRLPLAGGAAELTLPADSDIGLIRMTEPADQEERIERYEVIAVTSGGLEIPLCSGASVGRLRLRRIQDAVRAEKVIIRVTGPQPEYIDLAVFGR